jgi:hypothetical protein
LQKKAHMIFSPDFIQFYKAILVSRQWTDKWQLMKVG